MSCSWFWRWPALLYWNMPTIDERRIGAGTGRFSMVIADYVQISMKWRQRLWCSLKDSTFYVAVRENTQNRNIRETYAKFPEVNVSIFSSMMSWSLEVRQIRKMSSRWFRQMSGVSELQSEPRKCPIKKQSNELTRTTNAQGCSTKTNRRSRKN